MLYVQLSVLFPLLMIELMLMMRVAEIELYVNGNEIDLLFA